MVVVGVRELKAKLSRYLAEVEKGGHVLVTDRGREVAVLSPVSPERRMVEDLVRAGKARWGGGKPKGLEGIRVKGGPVSRTVTESRR